MRLDVYMSLFCCCISSGLGAQAGTVVLFLHLYHLHQHDAALLLWLVSQDAGLTGQRQQRCPILC